MELRPVKQYQEPKLPTRQLIDQHPELLRLVPKRWQTNPAVLTALAGVCTLMLGSRVLAANQPASVSKVAPIFEHGEGRAGFGGYGGDRNTFLSEDEARKIIEDEALKAGISFVADVHGTGGLNVPRPDRFRFLEEREELKKQGKIEEEKPGEEQTLGVITYTVDSSEYKERLRKEEGPLKELVFDGTNKKRSIHYEYVSEYDLKQWETRHHEGFCTVADYDIRSTADALRKSLAERKPEGTYVVFYDPLVSPRTLLSAPGRSHSTRPKSQEQIKAENEQMEKDVMQAGRQELRKQVQDFLRWLKSQGVI